ncbi:MAG: NHL repeat-containing protein [Pseudomonadota bacterium]
MDASLLRGDTLRTATTAGRPAAWRRLARRTSIVLLITCLFALPVQAYSILRLRPLFTIEHNFLQPSDVAVGKDHRVYVVDGVHNSIKVFDEQGAFKFSFGTKGAGNGQLNAPLGITTDNGTGMVYVADTGNHRIQLFSPDGAFVSQFDVRSGKKEKPSDPVDVALDESRKRLYVVDNDNHHVLVYSLGDYKLLSVWGSEGERREDFNYPFFIAVGRDTSVFVVDVINTRVQVWSPKGEPVSTIGGWGVDPGQFYRPKGVCVDKDNQIFVSDSYLGAVQVFNRYGNFKAVLGDAAGEILLWKTPVGITIDDRRLYVVEMLLNRVSVYEFLDAPL